MIYVLRRKIFINMYVDQVVLNFNRYGLLMKKLANILFFLPFLVPYLLHAEDMAGFIKTLKQPENQVKFCRQGFGFLTPSIRMGSGEECVKPIGATLAEYVCSGHSDYNKSQCAAKAKNVAVRTNEIEFLASNKAEVCRIIDKTISSLSNSCKTITVIVPQVSTPTAPTQPSTPSVKPASTLKYPTQYSTMGIEYLHQKGLSGKGVKVGVIDGIDTALDPRIKEMNFISKNIPSDHGTFVLGLIAGKQGGSNNERIGIAPDATVYFEKSGDEAALGKEGLRVTLEEPYFFDDGSLSFGLSIPAGDTIEWVFKGQYVERFHIAKSTNARTKMDSKYKFFASETDMLKDKSLNAKWQKMVKEGATTAELMGRGSLADPLKKATYLKEVIDIIKPIDKADVKKSLTDLVLDKDREVIYPTTQLRARIKGVSTIVILPEVDEAYASTINSLKNNGVTIINASLALAIGDKTREAIKQFGQSGGIFVKAAGNENIMISKMTGLRSPETNIAFDTHLHGLLKNDEGLRNSFLMVGALAPSLTKFADFSTRAGGITPNRYLTAWGEQILSYDYGKGPSATLRDDGTSYAAPVVSGILVLLKEAFPKCSAKELASYLLENTDSLGANQLFISGKGRVNGQKAYDKIMSSGKCK